MEHNDPADTAAFEKAAELLGEPLELPLDIGEPQSGDDFRRLATRHAFGDSWSRPGLEQRSRALVSVAIAATLGTREPLRGQLRIAVHNDVTSGGELAGGKVGYGAMQLTGPKVWGDYPDHDKGVRLLREVVAEGVTFV